ncbi:MAG: phosphatidylserine decarboxylase [Campylobacteraceae bacterium]|jgi:phosphatidylserine decarboxylase|nr:phosphatidylserine decarboxylase [Campylobacteraceae bacterium]
MNSSFTTTQIIAKEGWKVCGIAFMLFLLAVWANFAAFFMFVVLLFLLFVYRNPERIAAEDDPLAILAPIDGKITAIESVEKDGGKFLYVRIRSLPFDVSMVRSIISANLINIKITHGLSLPPNKKEAQKLNEQLEMNCIFQNSQFSIRIIAGVLARKIYFAKSKGFLKSCERIAFVTDGIVELFLPFDSRIKLSMGDYVKGGESVIGYFAYKG